MKTIFELQQIYLQACEKQEDLFQKELEYFINNIGKQIEENAEKGIDTTKFWVACGDCDIGAGYIKHARSQDVISKLEEHFIDVGFEVYAYDTILEIKLPSCENIKENEEKCE